MPSSGSGWWMTALADALSGEDSLELGIAWSSSRVPRVVRETSRRVTYYLLPRAPARWAPSGTRADLEQCRAAVEDFDPALVIYKDKKPLDGDQDGGGSKNARLYFIPTESGDHEIRAVVQLQLPLAKGEKAPSGEFILTIQQYEVAKANGKKTEK